MTGELSKQASNGPLCQNYVKNGVRKRPPGKTNKLPLKVFLTLMGSDSVPLPTWHADTET